YQARRIGEPNRIPKGRDLARRGPAGTGTAVEIRKRRRVQEQCFHSVPFQCRKQGLYLALEVESRWGDSNPGVLSNINQIWKMVLTLQLKPDKTKDVISSCSLSTECSSRKQVDFNGAFFEIDDPVLFDSVLRYSCLFAILSRRSLSAPGET